MTHRFCSLLAFCMATLIMPNVSSGQETADTQAIRALLTADQTAYATGDADGVLSVRDTHYCVFTVPKVDGELDFHGVSVRATPEDFKAFADPDWTASRVAALADTALNVESSHELARIDVKGDYAVAVSRIEWARNDTTKTNPNGSYRRVSGGWESLWFLRKIDGNWKFTGAVMGIKNWGGGG